MFRYQKTKEEEESQRKMLTKLATRRKRTQTRLVGASAAGGRDR